MKCTCARKILYHAHQIVDHAHLAIYRYYIAAYWHYTTKVAEICFAVFVIHYSIDYIICDSNFGM